MSCFLFHQIPLRNYRYCRHRTCSKMVHHRRHSACSSAPIAVQNVCFRWQNGRSALNNVSLNVREGELTMILGHNGSGKSTLLRVLRGVLNPSAGHVYLQKPCAYVQQDPNLQIVLPTIGTDIASAVPNHLRTNPSHVRNAVLNALDAVGLTPPEDFLPKSSYRLSGGQRQRAAVAAALAMEPRTILFDEVTANMDPFNKAELVSRIRQIVTERSLAAIWVTHLLDELEFADSIAIMTNGNIIAQGPRVAMMPLVFDLQDAMESSPS